VHERSDDGVAGGGVAQRELVDVEELEVAGRSRDDVVEEAGQAGGDLGAERLARGGG
jgi:hypothetical protein